jgi:hypothetical protein
MDAQLGVGAREMALDRAFADEQRGGDGRRALSRDREGDDLALPAAQRLRARRVPPRPGAGQLAGEEGLDGVEYLVGVAQSRPVIDAGYHINLTCIMIGEHVSDWIRGEA